MSDDGKEELYETILRVPYEKHIDRLVEDLMNQVNVIDMEYAYMKSDKPEQVVALRNKLRCLIGTLRGEAKDE